MMSIVGQLTLQIQFDFFDINPSNNIENINNVQ